MLKKKTETPILVAPEDQQDIHVRGPKLWSPETAAKNAH